MVARQRATGIDLVNDGEYGHSMGHRYDFGPWWTYVFQRLGGLEMVAAGQLEAAEGAGEARASSALVVASPSAGTGVQFSDAYGDPNSGVALPNRENRRSRRSAAVRSPTTGARRCSTTSPTSRRRWPPPGWPTVS